MKAAIALILLAQAASAQAGCSPLVVANTVDSAHAGGLYSLMESMGCEPLKADSRSYGMLKDTRVIVILGGHMSPEGVGDIVSRLISEADKAALSAPNASRTFRLENVSLPGQRIIIFAGYSAEDTERAWRTDAEAALAPLLTRPRLVLSAPAALELKPMNNMLAYSFPVNVTNDGPGYAEVSAEAYLNGGVRLTVKPSAFNLTAGRMQRVMVTLNPKGITGDSTVAFTASGHRADTNISLAGSGKAPPCNCAAGG